VTTMEAVARALGVLEGPVVCDALLAPLRLMTRLQVRSFSTFRPCPCVM
jgi:hypothetical protein